MKTPRRKKPASSSRIHKTPRRRVHKQLPPPQLPASPPPVSAPALSVAHVIVPIDFSHHSRNALHYAVALASTVGASIHLVFVVEPTIYPADLGFGQVVLPGIEDELRKKAQAELEDLVKEEVCEGLVATTSIRTGSPHQEILDEAEERGADLIVVAAHGHSGMEQLLFGSTADRIVHHAKCPVLVVRPIEDASR